MVGKESEASWVAAPAESEEPSRYVRRSAHLPHIREAERKQAEANRRIEAEADPTPPAILHAAEEPQVVIDLREATSRYERRSGALPHLTDDPDWESPVANMPQPIREEKRRGLRRLRPRLRRS